MRAVDVVVVPAVAATADDALGDPAAGSSASATCNPVAASPFALFAVARPAPVPASSSSDPLRRFRDRGALAGPAAAASSA